MRTPWDLIAGVVLALLFVIAGLIGYANRAHAATPDVCTELPPPAEAMCALSPPPCVMSINGDRKFCEAERQVPCQRSALTYRCVRADGSVYKLNKGDAN